ncbi:MAG: site-2 protease family protein [Candidatus Odinarchaeota archaeon]|nr:site-2 protease family protein [Candidatus Odinarchaeota archaeon]
MFEVLFYLLVLWIIIYSIGKMKIIKNLSVEPFLAIFRTTKLNSLIDNLSFKYKHVWEGIKGISVVSSYFFMLYSIYFLTQNLLNFFVKPEEASAIVPMIPGVTITTSTFIYIMIPLFFLMFFHELFHGIMARIRNIKVSSSGFLLFFIIMGAFVEIDEDGIKKSDRKTRIAIFSAGSFANMLTTIVLTILLLNFVLIVSPFYVRTGGALVYDVSENSPAYGKIDRWDVIIGVNGTIFEEFEDFSEYMRNVSPGDVLIIMTERGNVTLIAAQNPHNSSRGYIGVATFPYFRPKPMFEWLGPILPYHLYQILSWSWTISFSLVIFNMLPFPLLDGGRIIDTIAESLSEKRERLGKIFSISVKSTSLLLLLLNIFLTFLTIGFVPL